MAYTDIDKPSDYFNTVLYTGNGSTKSITGVGFQPDFGWFKQRNGTTWHGVHDSIRGGSKVVYTNEDDAEYTDATNYVKSFDSDGYTVGSNGTYNTNNGSYVVWSWLAGGTASSNTDGSITSSVSANTTAGISIVSYTGNGTAGATIGHGLGATPHMIIIKNRTDVENWPVYHHKLTDPSEDYLKLNSTDAQVDGAATTFNSTLPTSSVFTAGSDNRINANTDTYIAYCFTAKKGYSKFGSYKGNENANGPFVYLGFKPAWVMVKTRTDSGYNWVIYDNKRVGFNPDNDTLTANETRIEQTTGFGHIDMLSNGFKVRASTKDTNNNNNIITYMAFAENPFVTSTGIPTTAR